MVGPTFTACQSVTQPLSRGSTTSGDTTGGRTQGDNGKRAAGSPCVYAEECESQQCIELDGKTQCATRCFGASDCSDALRCQQVSPRDAESPSICAPQTDQKLCHACETDADCGSLGNACLEGVCGRDCRYDDTCPTGYACRDFSGEEGKVVTRQCVPNVGTCDCNENTRGQMRPCVVGNSYGTCKGTEYCQPGAGYVGCNAASPAPETCNGKDDDCDGATDESLQDPAKKLEQACGSGLGLCFGVETCTNGSFSGCTAPVAAAEVCDGLDNNCDGSVDEYLKQSPNSCGTCGAVCAPGPAYDGTTERSCNPSGQTFACGEIRCRNFQYDVDGDVANGCEVQDDLRPDPSQEGHFILHSYSSTAVTTTCHVDDWDNSWCDFWGRFPSDHRQHVSWPYTRVGPGFANSEDWFVVRGEDDDFADLQVRTMLDVTSLPSSNLYEVCQTWDDDNTGSMPSSCGSAPSSAAAKWCNGFCCCVYGGSAVGIAADSDDAGHDTDPSGDDTGNYYVRVKWKSGTAVTKGDYTMRVCDESGTEHCQR